MATQRLFFALWPDDLVRAQVAAAARAVISPCRGKPVLPANYHITLAFLGEMPDERLDCVAALGDGLRGHSFSLTLDTFGYFPKAHVAWLGVSEVPPELAELHGRLARALPYCELVPEARPFHPHLTLVRKAVRGPEPAVTTAIPWQVNEYVLVASDASSEGSSYRPLRRWGLSGDDP